VQTLVSADVPNRGGAFLHPRFQAEVEARIAKSGIRVVREDRSTPTLFVGVVAATGHPDFPKAVALRVWVALLSPDGAPTPRSHVWDSDESGMGLVHLANEDEAATVALRAVIEKVELFVSRVEPVGKAARPR
jgi:hypothetical protein